MRRLSESDVNGMLEKKQATKGIPREPLSWLSGLRFWRLPASWVSKRQAQRKLHDPRIAREGRYFASRAAADVVAGLSELDRIGQIEYLPAELQSDGLVDREVAHQGKIKDIRVRSTECVAANVAQESWALQLVRVCQTRCQSFAGSVVGNEIPTGLKITAPVLD